MNNIFIYNNENSKYFKLIFDILFYIVLCAAIAIFSLGSKNVLAIFLSILYAACLIAVRYRRFNIWVERSISATSLILLCLIVKCCGIKWMDFNIIVLYIPLIYSYILTDLYFPILSGFVIAVISLGYFGQLEFKQIIGNLFAIIAVSITYSSIFYLLRRLAEERDKYKATSVTDSLTGLPNLNYVIFLGEQMIENNESVAAFVMDIDHFKQFNDTYGHLIGNKVLIEIARKLKKLLENVNSVVGRLGGDEYVILVRNFSYVEAQELYKKISEALKDEYFECDPELAPVRISCSIGMAYSTVDTPIHMQELLHYADTNMYYVKQRRSNISLNNDFDYILDKEEGMLINVLAEKDMYSFVHSQYVVQHATMLAKALGLPNEKVEQIGTAAWLHDIGKLTIPNNILRKRSKLSDEEYNMIKSHVIRGLDLMSFLNLSDTIKNAIKYHHERIDGKGYPYGISGEQIPIEAKIMQIADAFSAMTVKRVYRELVPIDIALKELERCKEKQFDPVLVDIFIRLFYNAVTEN